MMPSTRKKGLYVLLGLAIIWGAYNMTAPRRSKTDPGPHPTPALTPAAPATAAEAPAAQ